MLNNSFTDFAITIRYRSTDVMWQQICDVLITANKSDTTDEIMARMPFSVNSDVFFILRSCLQTSDPLPDWATIGYCFEAIGKVYKTLVESQSIEMVWSGPNSDVFPVRRIDQVLYDLINEAQNEILIVTFAAAKIPRLRDAILNAIKRGVEVKLILEFEAESEGQLSIDALNAFAGSLSNRVGVYCWPNENRERNARGKPGKLHAKCAVIDNSALISSANLTDDAFNRNMELGILLKGGNTPSLIRQHFYSLIESKIITLINYNNSSGW